MIEAATTAKRKRECGECGSESAAGRAQPKRASVATAKAKALAGAQPDARTRASRSTDDESATLCPETHFEHDLLLDPTKQIRLLQVLPDERNQPIRLSSGTCWLDQVQGKYNAISYTWGPPETRLLFIDGKPFNVRQNAYYALWQVRLHRPGELVWIDSICIKQDGVYEKGHQVSMMWDIYSNADQVLSSIGPHADNSERIVEAAGELHSSWLREVESTGEMNPDLDHVSWATSRGESYLTSLQRSYESFLDRPYWRRLWIIQEVMAVSTIYTSRILVLCGQDAMPFNGIWRLDLLLRTQLDGSELQVASRMSSLAQYHHLSTILAFLSEYPGLGNIFVYTAKFLCADARDRLYGVLHLLMWPAGIPALSADYSMSTWSLLVEIAFRIGVVSHQLEQVVEALELTDFEAECRHMIRRRIMDSATQPAGCTDESRAPRRGTRYPYPWNSLWARCNMFLTAAFIRPHHLCLNPQSLLDVNIRDAIERDVAVCFPNEELPLKDTIQRHLPAGIVHDGKLIALVPRQTRVGDIIYNGSWHKLLILRVREDQLCEIGQGLIVEDKRIVHDTKTSLDFFGRMGGDYRVDGGQPGMLYGQGEVRMSGQDVLTTHYLTKHCASGMLSLMMQPIAHPGGVATLDLKLFDPETRHTSAQIKSMLGG